MGGPPLWLITLHLLIKRATFGGPVYLYVGPTEQKQETRHLLLTGDDPWLLICWTTKKKQEIRHLLLTKELLSLPLCPRDSLKQSHVDFSDQLL